MTSQYEKLRPIVFSSEPIVNQPRSVSQTIFGNNLTKVTNSSCEIPNYYMKCKKINTLQQCQSTTRNDKENTKDATSSIKNNEITFLKQRIVLLEKMNSQHIQEINQLNTIIQKQMESTKQNEGLSSEVMQIQLSSQKHMISELETKIKSLSTENLFLKQKLDEQGQLELDKYKTKCYLLQNKVKQFQEEKKVVDLHKKAKKILDENQQLKKTIEYLQTENSSLQQQLLSNTGVSNLRSKGNEMMNELETQNKYMSSMIELDQVKMRTLEEKVELLTKENKRLQDIIKHKKNDQVQQRY